MKYKLLTKYPGLPDNWEIGMIIEKTKNEYYFPCDKKYKPWSIHESHLDPIFWKEIFTQTPFVIHYLGNVILGVTRLKDNVYFSQGLRVKRPHHDEIGFIYGFRLEEDILIIDHTFKYLMDSEGFKDHLDVLRPCLYTKEDLIIQ